MQLLQTKVSKVLGGMLCGTVEALVLQYHMRTLSAIY